ncbi:MAG: GNAT family N-acetyltransferase [Marinibacterium sp.]|nr:GNAT family N-acetyltransferase [Marinibacterium sp.]
MTPMTQRQATRAEIDQMLEWAASEGWNPGLADAGTFWDADPEGYFVTEIDGQIIAAISVVCHDPGIAFLGLYICHPNWRGQGHGLALWTHALAHAGDRTVGLDGVPDQQDNYARSGFVLSGQTTRYAGHVAGGAPAVIATPAPEPLIAADARAIGYRRDRFARSWFTDTATRRTVQLASDRLGFATFRACREGIKIGPFYAETEEDARALLAACPADLGAGPCFIDVPDSAPALSDLVTGLGFEPVFHTARMWRGTAPKGTPPPFQAAATLELG